MALITSYATLKSELALALNRTDLTDEIVVMIQLAEQRFQRDPRVRDPANNAVLSPLSTTDPNWLLTAHPDIYYYGALAESAPFLHDDERIPVWEKLYEDRVSTLFGSVRLDPNRTLSLITSYATLQTAVADAVNQGDLKNVIPTAIYLAEQRFEKDPRVRDPANNSALVPLSTTDPNWLLTAHPDIYYYGTLVELAPWLHDASKVPEWAAMLEQRIAALSGSVRLNPARTLALTTYGELQTVVADVLNRGDLKNVIPVLITLAEKSLARDDRLRKLVRTSYSINGDGTVVPTGFHQLQSWYHDSSTARGPIEIVGAAELPVLKARYGVTGVPAYAAILDGYFYYAPIQTGSTYTTVMTYWKTLGSVAAGTSWLFTESPDIYLYATLVESRPYAPEAYNPEWKVMLEERIEKHAKETWNTHFSGTMRRRFNPIGG